MSSEIELVGTESAPRPGSRNPVLRQDSTGSRAFRAWLPFAETLSASRPALAVGLGADHGPCAQGVGGARTFRILMPLDSGDGAVGAPHLTHLQENSRWRCRDSRAGQTRHGRSGAAFTR
jgi:hypothetical protein